MTSLLLARHGNTFESGQTPTFVGARTDMELTEKGRAQSQAVTDFVVAMKKPVTSLLSSPLKRTWFLAEMIGKETGVTPRADERLREIDYGLWENLTESEITARYGVELLANWTKNGQWPEGMNWKPDQETMRAQIKSLLEEEKSRAEGLAIIITSNGILRFIYEAVTGQKPDTHAKVATGNLCQLVLKQGNWNIEAWNLKPEGM
ncbi:MAG: histidine phosphatase family protein [Alphaproteobacteria bacterium]|nr:histidine phosphatase family protein [Alphaproteobacteria bacterium]